jgi:hypothetical protein
MSAKNSFDQLLDTANPLLKQLGFRKKSSSFYLELNGNLSILNFQRSTKSDAKTVIFTLNLGVCIKRLLNFLDPETKLEKLTLDQCHWRERIGNLMPERSDKWWAIASEQDLENVSRQLTGFVLPTAAEVLKTHLADEYMKRIWETGQSPGLTDVQRQVNLSALYKLDNDEDKLRLAISQLEDQERDKPSWSMVQRHIAFVQGSSR